MPSSLARSSASSRAVIRVSRPTRALLRYRATKRHHGLVGIATPALYVLDDVVMRDPVAYGVAHLEVLRRRYREDHAQWAVIVQRLLAELVIEVVVDQAEQREVFKEQDQFGTFPAEQFPGLEEYTSLRLRPPFPKPSVMRTARWSASLSSATAGLGSVLTDSHTCLASGSSLFTMPVEFVGMSSGVNCG